jgi:hypothetical protein
MDLAEKTHRLSSVSRQVSALLTLLFGAAANASAAGGAATGTLRNQHVDFENSCCAWNLGPPINVDGSPMAGFTTRDSNPFGVTSDAREFNDEGLVLGSGYPV